MTRPLPTSNVRGIELSAPFGPSFGETDEDSFSCSFTGLHASNTPEASSLVGSGVERRRNCSGLPSDGLNGFAFEGGGARGRPLGAVSAGLQRPRHYPSVSSLRQTIIVAFENIREFVVRQVGGSLRAGRHAGAPYSLLNQPLLSSRRRESFGASSSFEDTDESTNVEGGRGGNRRAPFRFPPEGGPPYFRGREQAASGLRNRRVSSAASDRATAGGTAGAAGEDKELASDWDAVADLDRFVVGVYTYWAEGGLYAMLCSHASHLVVLGFTVYFSWFLLMFVNWEGIVSCASPDACASVPLLVPSPWSPWGPRQTFCSVYVLSLSCVVLTALISAVNKCKDAMALRLYFRSRLYIHCDSSLQLMGWPEVAALLLQAQQQHPFCLVKQNLSVLDLVAIIMREDNYLVALTNREILTRSLPAYIHPKLLYTRVLLWSIRHAIFYNLFDKKQNLRHHLFTTQPPRGSVYRTAAARLLSQRFLLFGFLHFLLLIPLLLFCLCFFFLKYAEAVRQSEVSLSSREFTGYSCWLLREFNELPHQLATRLALASRAADAYLSLHPRSPSLYRLKLTVKYIIGSLLAVCLLLLLWEDAPLLVGKPGGRGLLGATFFLGVFYAALSQGEGPPASGGGGPGLNAHSSRGGHGAGPLEEDASTVDFCPRGCPAAAAAPLRQQHSPLQLYQQCMRLVSFTHFLPPAWTSASWKISFISPLVGDAEEDAKSSSSTATNSSSDTAGPAARRHHHYHRHRSHQQQHQQGKHSQRRRHAERAGSNSSSNNENSSSSRRDGVSTPFVGYDAAQRGAFHSVSSQHREAMRDLCSSIYSLRVFCLLDELVAVLLAPFLFAFYLPSIADDISDCLYTSTITTPFGDLCCFSNLDVAAYGSPDYKPPPTLLKQQQQEQQQYKQQQHDNGTDRVTSGSVSPSLESHDNDRGLEKGHRKSRLFSEKPSLGREGGLAQPTAGFSLSTDLPHSLSGQYPHLASSDAGPLGGVPIVPALQRFLPTNGKLEKSALSFLLTYRIAAPYDDTSPLWAVLASRRITQTLMAASARNVGAGGAPALNGGPGDSSGALFTIPGTPVEPMIHWGAPPSAGSLLAGLEAFQQQLLQQQPFLLQELPASLTQLQRGVPAGGPPHWGPLHAACGPRPITEEEKAAYFFWLEKLHETNSGRFLFATNQLNFFTRALFKQPRRGPVNHSAWSSSLLPVERRGRGLSGGPFSLGSQNTPEAEGPLRSASEPHSGVRASPHGWSNHVVPTEELLSADTSSCFVNSNSSSSSSSRNSSKRTQGYQQPLQQHQVLEVQAQRQEQDLLMLQQQQQQQQQHQGRAAPSQLLQLSPLWPQGEEEAPPFAGSGLSGGYSTTIPVPEAQYSHVGSPLPTLLGASSSHTEALRGLQHGPLADSQQLLLQQLQQKQQQLLQTIGKTTSAAAGGPRSSDSDGSIGEAVDPPTDALQQQLSLQQQLLLRQLLQQQQLIQQQRQHQHQQIQQQQHLMNQHHSRRQVPQQQRHQRLAQQPHAQGFALEGELDEYQDQQQQQQHQFYTEGSRDTSLGDSLPLQEQHQQYLQQQQLQQLQHQQLQQQIQHQQLQQQQARRLTQRVSLEAPEGLHPPGPREPMDFA
ncbi:hypothetical protein Esti_003344 [Eimeria stiedai]